MLPVLERSFQGLREQHGSRIPSLRPFQLGEGKKGVALSSPDFTGVFREEGVGTRGGLTEMGRRQGQLGTGGTER